MLTRRPDDIAAASLSQNTVFSWTSSRHPRKASREEVIVDRRRVRSVGRADASRLAGELEVLEVWRCRFAAGEKTFHRRASRGARIEAGDASRKGTGWDGVRNGFPGEVVAEAGRRGGPI